MRSVLTRSKWIVLSVIVALVIAAFISLGFWQLRRLDERRLNNAVLEARVGRTAVALEEVLAAGVPLADLEYTHVVFSGVPDVAGSVFVRSQTHDGTAGSHQVTPVVLDDGSAVLVNAGWVPLNVFPVEIPGWYGPIEIEGYVRPSQAQPPFGQREPDGPLREIRRIDIPRLAGQYPYPLAGAWVQLVTPDVSGVEPHPVALPLQDEGAHLAYAVQWFSFALISGVGFVLLVGREARLGEGPGGHHSYVVEDDALS